MTKHILVVDDDIDILEQVELTLKGAGYAVTAAEGQEDAEEKLLTFEPDLVIADLMMEEKDSGFVLCHQVKKMYPETPVIMMTAVASATGLSFTPHDGEDKTWVKADAFLDKPVLPEKLLYEVKHLLA